MSDINRFMHECFYMGGRGSGKTWAMINGVKELDKEVYVVCAHKSVAHEVMRQCPKAKIIMGKGALDKIRGTNCPLVFDHAAYEYFWMEREREFRIEMEKLIKERR